jgi:hypothetical protein
VIRAAYQLLGLQTYFTAGPKEVRAWTVRKGATAPQAAGVIHTDFERGFIRAEVIGFDDYVTMKGEQGAKESGKLRLEGLRSTSCARATSCTSASTSSPRPKALPHAQLVSHRSLRSPERASQSITTVEPGDSYRK